MSSMETVPIFSWPSIRTRRWNLAAWIVIIGVWGLGSIGTSFGDRVIHSAFVMWAAGIGFFSTRQAVDAWSTGIHVSRFASDRFLPRAAIEEFGIGRYPRRSFWCVYVKMKDGTEVPLPVGSWRKYKVDAPLSKLRDWLTQTAEVR
jgi:hypothetical protein